VHPLDYISAVVEHPSNILRVHRAGEMWIAVVFTISAGRADSLRAKRKRERRQSFHRVLATTTTKIRVLKAALSRHFFRL